MSSRPLGQEGYPLSVSNLPFKIWAPVWALFLALALTWPAALQLNDAALGHPYADGMKHVWTLWWFRRMALTEGVFPFQTDYVNFPEGMALYPIEPLNSLVACLLGFVPLIAITNLLAIANLALTGLFGAWLGRELSGGSNAAAFAAGTLLQGAAITLFTIHVGVGELQHVWLLPLGFTLWLRMRRDPSPARAAWLGLALAGAVLSCFYHGFFLALGVSALSLTTLWAGGARPTGRLLAHYAAAAGLSLLIVAPVTRIFATSYGHDDAPRVSLSRYVLEDGHGQPITDPPATRLDPAQLIQPADGRRANASNEEMAYGGGRYLGWPALILALGALLLRPRQTLPWVVVGGVGVTVALGSYLVSGVDEVLHSSGGRYRMPMLFFNRALGFAAEPLNFPARALALTATALAAAAGLLGGVTVKRGPLARGSAAGRSLGPAVALLAVVNVADVQRHQLVPHPLPTITLPDYAPLAPLADSSGAMIDLSLAWRSDQENRAAALTAQLLHGQRVQGVPVDRLEFFAREGRLFVRSFPLVRALEQAMSRPDGRLDPADFRADFALLRDAGFSRAIVLGTGPMKEIPAGSRRALTEVLGDPEISHANFLVFALPEVGATDAELTRWRAEHEERMVEEAANMQMRLYSRDH
jgi:hypothetical protein